MNILEIESLSNNILSKSRTNKYQSLLVKIGNTPFYELKHLSIPNGNRIFAKLEYESVGGSHYDRVYVNLIKNLEQEGKIFPGKTHLVETTTGNAGASFAWIASELGYDCTVIIPDSVSPMRKHQILDRGARLILSPADQYVQGAITTLRHYLIDRKSDCKAGLLYCVNHSHDLNAVTAVSPIADEIISELMESNLKADYLILGCGNGTTIRGVGGRMKEISPDTKCIAFDPFEAPVAFDRKYPGRYLSEFGVAPGNKSHRILGTGGWGVLFPNIVSSEFLSIVDDVELVKDEDMISAQKDLELFEQKYPGRSSAAAVAVVKKLANHTKDNIFVVIFYDELNLYSI